MAPLAALVESVDLFLGRRHTAPAPFRRRSTDLFGYVMSDSIRWNPPPPAVRLLQTLPFPAWFETAPIEAGIEGQEDCRDGGTELIPR